MMIILVLNFFFSAFAQMDWKEALKKKYYFTGLHQFLLASQQIKIVSEKQALLLEEILLLTGVDVLHEYEENILKKFPGPSINFHFGRTNIMKKNYSAGIEYLKKIPKEHRYRPEVLYLISFAQLQLGEKFINVSPFLKECKERSKKMIDKSKPLHQKKFYSFLHDSCAVQEAREYFNKGDYQQAIDLYNQIDKRSLKWPYLILERAWASYHVGDYNRSLGLLVTYQSPLLADYFQPEAEILVALNYFRLCLYQDAEFVVDNFYQKYRPIIEDLKGELAKNELFSRSYKVLQEKSDMENVHPSIKKVLAQVARQSRYSMDLSSLKLAEDELSKLKKEDLSNKADIFHLDQVIGNFRNKINRYTREEVVKFINQLHLGSEELFKIKLEIINQKKSLIYQQKELVSDRSRGSTKNVKRSRFEYFWNFNGAFWADEIGDYSFGLKSNCEYKKTNQEEL